MERLGLNRNIRIKNEIKRYWQKQSNQKIHLKESIKPNNHKINLNESIKQRNQKIELEKEIKKSTSKQFQEEKVEKNNDKLSKKRKDKLEKNSQYLLENHKKRKMKSRRRKLIFCICVFVPILLFELFTTLIEPSIIAMCEIRANSIGVSVSNKAIKQVMEEVGYDMQLVKLEKDEAGNILALQANVVEMNYIASLIGSRTQQMYNELTEAYVKIPIGNFTGNALLAGRGPSIQVKIVPVGTVGSDFKTEFVSTGINQTRHRVYLQVISSMRVIAPFTTKTIKVVNNVNVAETVLIGDVPNSYYNLEGVDNVVDDSLNLWDE